MVWPDFSAYVHFPYCRSICDFCNYETRLINKRGVSSFGAAATAEIRQFGEWADFSKSRLRSVFFGGGTASLMPGDTMAAILDEFRGIGSVEEIPEVTLECEPGTIRSDALAAARVAGVNRISVCAQSFNDDELARITRKHSVADSLRLIDDAVSAGISNLHLDLMYGLQGQSVGDWEKTLRRAVELPFVHVSAYKLYVFKYGAVDRSGQVPRPDEETPEQTARFREMHDLAQAILHEAGYEQYTLTEWARPGYKATYLTDTFSGGAVLPIGPSSFGRANDTVWHNSSYVHQYSQQESWAARRRGIDLSPAEAFKRNVILGLWLLEVDLESPAVLRGSGGSAQLMELLRHQADQGRVDFDGRRVKLRPGQRFDAGQVMRELSELDAEAWLRDEGEPEDPSSNTLNPRMSSLVRILRNDPALYNEVVETPDTTVRRVATGIGDDEVGELIAAVRGDHQAASPAMRELWEQVQSEHVSRRRARARLSD